MSNEDTGEIIKDFLDLWQKQFTYMSKDPENIMNSMKMFQDMQNNYFSSINKASSKNAEPDSVTDILKSIIDELRKLEQRFTDIETRITELESLPAGTRGGNKRKAAGQKPAGVKKGTGKTGK